MVTNKTLKPTSQLAQRLKLRSILLETTDSSIRMTSLFEIKTMSGSLEVDEMFGGTVFRGLVLANIMYNKMVIPL